MNIFLGVLISHIPIVLIAVLFLLVIYLPVLYLFKKNVYFLTGIMVGVLGIIYKYYGEFFAQQVGCFMAEGEKCGLDQMILGDLYGKVFLILAALVLAIDLYKKIKRGCEIKKQN